MLPGTEIGAALTALEAMQVDVIGLNCATGPAEMGEPLRHLTEHARIPVTCLPNAGLPSVVDGKMHYDLTPDQLAEFHRQFVTELGVSVIGGCCGTTPGPPGGRGGGAAPTSPRPPGAPRPEPGAASIYTHVPFAQDTSFLVVGERTNANGSKKFREAMLEGDWDTCVAMAREQVKEGSHVIDVCVDYTGADGVADMKEVASRFATQSTRAADGRLHRGARWSRPPCRGSAAGPSSTRSTWRRATAAGTRLDSFLTLAQEFGAAVVCTCIDTEGQARTADWKVRAARAIHDIAVDRYGLRPSDLLFDPLALPLSTGMEESRRDGIETIEGIRRIKAELPGVYTILGPLQRLLRPQPGRPPGAQLGVPPRVRRGRARRRHRARLQDPPPLQDRRPGPRGLPGPHLRPPPRRATTRSPSCWPSSRGRRASRSPPRRTASAGRSSGASSSGSSTATATASRPTSTRPWPPG